MLIAIIRDLLIILLGIMFAYLYGYIEHDYIRQQNISAFVSFIISQITI